MVTGQATLHDSFKVEELSEAVRGFANRRQAASTSAQNYGVFVGTS
jgi:hypothetical protein